MKHRLILFAAVMCFAYSLHTTAQTGTLKDKNNEVMRGTPMVLGKTLTASNDFAKDLVNWYRIQDGGYNTVRLCWVGPWYSDREKDHWSVDELLLQIDTCVQHAIETGMNIIINYHNVGEQQDIASVNASSFDLLNEFWEKVAPRYKDNDLVFYEITNEPTFWWNNYLDPDFKEGVLGVYDTVRSLAPERQVIMFSFNRIDYDIENVVSNYQDDLDWDFTSIAYHMYSSTSSSRVQNLMSEHRVICTEWDYAHRASQHDYIREVDGYRQNSQTLEAIGSSWTDWRDWTDITLNEILDTVPTDAEAKGYWWVTDLIDPTALVIVDTLLEVIIAKTGSVYAFVLPSNANNKTINWSSADTTIATVDEAGIVTGRSHGLTSITGTTSIGAFVDSFQVSVLEPPFQAAYPDSIPHLVPDTILAVHYDFGGEGIAYHDNTSENSGEGIRQDEGVDCNGGNIGWIDDDEWLEYTFHVNKTAVYGFQARLAAPASNGIFHLEIDEVDLTGPVNVISTGSWGDLKTFTLGKYELEEGVHIMRMYTDHWGYNVNSIIIDSMGGPLRDIELFQDSVSVNVDESLALVLTLIPANPSDTTVTWSSDDESIATVNETGEITGQTEGTTTIRATSRDGGFETNCKVTVNKVSSLLATKDSGVKLYPVPVHDLLHIELGDYSNFDTIGIYDIKGRNLIRIYSSDTFKGNIDVEDLQKGYFILTINSGAQIKALPFIKN